MLIGEANTGKTTCYQILADALTYLRENRLTDDPDHQIVEYATLNPKSITMGELFGSYSG